MACITIEITTIRMNSSLIKKMTMKMMISYHRNRVAITIIKEGSSSKQSLINLKWMIKRTAIIN